MKEKVILSTDSVLVQLLPGTGELGKGTRWIQLEIVALGGRQVCREVFDADVHPDLLRILRRLAREIK